MPSIKLPTPKAPQTLMAPISISALVDETFKRLDLDLSGAISLGEVMRALGPAGKSPLAGVVSGLALMQFDANKDGTVSRAEFKAVLDRVDGDQSGTLAQTEIQKAGAELIGVLSLVGPPQPPGG